EILRMERETVTTFELDEDARKKVPGRIGNEAEDGERVDRLAAPRLPHDAEGLTGPDIEGDAVDSPRRAAALLGHEIGLQVPHAQQRLGHTASLRGSSASRNASPTAVSAITTRE